MSTQSDLYVGEYPVDMTPKEAADEIARQAHETYLCQAEIVAAELRALRCVEALATIPDPQAFMEAARGMREALADALELIDDHLPGEFPEPVAEFRKLVLAFDATLGEQ